MEKIDYKHWVENTLSISFLNFWVDINIKCRNNNPYVQIEVVDGNMQRFVFEFSTLEKAIDFTENVINRYDSIQKIAVIYEEKYGKYHVDKKVNKIALTPEEIEQAIVDYFGFNKNYRVSVLEKLDIKDNKIDVTYYLVEYLNYNKREICLTKGDLKKAFSNYIALYNYELIDFEYIGEINKSGDLIVEDSIIYRGIELSVKEKGKMLVLD